jgi:transcriptional regulator with PAS, ATPase and Fis domain
LDEIGDLPMEMQPKLLRVLEDKEFERVGGNQVIRSDFRLIAASNQHLEELLTSGAFRKDLFYRLNVIRLHISPLRDRREDIVELSRHLLKTLAREANLPLPYLDATTLKDLIDYDWPGNVRELSNALERALASVDGDTIQPEDLPFHICQKGRRAEAGKPASIREVQHQAEKEAIEYALKACEYNKSQAARRLGIHRTLLYKKMKKHGIAIASPPN